MADCLIRSLLMGHKIFLQTLFSFFKEEMKRWLKLRPMGLYNNTFEYRMLATNAQHSADKSQRQKIVLGQVPRSRKKKKSQEWKSFSFFYKKLCNFVCAATTYIFPLSSFVCLLLRNFEFFQRPLTQNSLQS